MHFHLSTRLPWHFLTSPATAQALSCLSVLTIDGNSKFISKVAPPVLGASINHGGYKHVGVELELVLRLECNHFVGVEACQLQNSERRLASLQQRCQKKREALD